MYKTKYVVIGDDVLHALLVMLSPLKAHEAMDILYTYCLGEMRQGFLILSAMHSRYRCLSL